jgi:predicted transcriptional regulator of viral defense system
LFERALDQYGYVTTRDAVELHIPPVELRKIAQRGGVKHVAYGLYRFDDVPRTGRDQLMEAVLRVGPDAYLSHDAVLALHELALVNPRRIRVGTPKRARPQLPPYIEVLHRRLEPRDLTTYEGIPSATVARALLDCRGLAMGERLIDAAREAARRGLLNRREADRILAELGAAA